MNSLSGKEGKLLLLLLLLSYKEYKKDTERTINITLTNVFCPRLFFFSPNF